MEAGYHFEGGWEHLEVLVEAEAGHGPPSRDLRQDLIMSLSGPLLVSTREVPCLVKRSDLLDDRSRREGEGGGEARRGCLF